MAKLSTEAGTIVRDANGGVTINKSFEVYLGLYQAITGPEEHQKLFREFSPNFLRPHRDRRMPPRQRRR